MLLLRTDKLPEGDGWQYEVLCGRPHKTSSVALHVMWLSGTLGGAIFDAVILGHAVDGKPVYVARTRSGFTPALRAELLRKMKPLEVSECPFCNLPESRPGRWGEGLTADKMTECRWLRPELAGRFEFLEWTEDRHLRHSTFLELCR
jgi:ATP-dependent DNA ligase